MSSSSFKHFLCYRLFCNAHSSIRNIGEIRALYHNHHYHHYFLMSLAWRCSELAWRCSEADATAKYFLCKKYHLHDSAWLQIIIKIYILVLSLLTLLISLTLTDCCLLIFINLRNVICLYISANTSRVRSWLYIYIYFLHLWVDKWFIVWSSLISHVLDEIGDKIARLLCTDIQIFRTQTIPTQMVSAIFR